MSGEEGKLEMHESGPIDNNTGFSHVGAPFKTKNIIEQSGDSLNQTMSVKDSMKVIDIEAAEISFN